MKLTFKNLLIYLLLTTVFCFFYWVWMILDEVKINGSWLKIIPYLFDNALTHPTLRPITFKAMGISYGGLALLIYFIWSEESKKTTSRVISGARIVDMSEAKNLTREHCFTYWVDGVKEILMGAKRQKKQIEIASIPMPKQVESVHTILVGATGSGKSVAQDEMIFSALQRGDRLVIVDPSGHAFECFGKKGDLLLNPFDVRGNGWNPFNELKEKQDFSDLANSIIPDAKSSGDQSWHGYARTLLAECLQYLSTTGNMNTNALIEMATITPKNELAKLLAGTKASGLFDPDAGKALASSRFILTQYLIPYSFLDEGKFSLRHWLENNKNSNLFITWKESQLQILKPLITTWLEVLIKTILSGPKSDKPIWLFIDELASLEKMGGLLSAITKTRKFGLRIVAGLQSISQLEAIYGRDDASTLRQNFRNIIVLGGSNSDPHTANELSKGLGESKIQIFETTFTKSANGTSESKSTKFEVKPAVSATEIMQLNPNFGYLKFAGDYPIIKIKLTPRNYPIKNKSFKAK